MADLNKTIAVSEDVYNKLRVYIAQKRFKTFSDGIESLLEEVEE